MAGESTLTWSKELSLESKKSPFDAPIAQTHHKAFNDVKPVSWTRLVISGILITIYGLEELTTTQGQIACCWLLHGRGDTQDSMAPVAAAFIHAWLARKRPGQPGLICICFDQRNHGSRMVDHRRNQAFKKGNQTHATDMYSTYSGTSQDVSLLITHLPAYIGLKPSINICSGVSLGGHATWQCMFSDPRVVAGIIVVGCPDYIRLMTDRAIRARLESCMTTNPPGRAFLGSKDFPQSLVEAVEEADPAGILLGELDTVTGDDHLHRPSDTEIARLQPIMHQRLTGKSFLLLSGAKDRLVPAKLNEPFLSWFKRSLDSKDGWFKDGGVSLQDIVDSDAGHEFSVGMRHEAERWLCTLLSSSGMSAKASKI